MPNTWPADLVFEAWDDTDRVVAGLTESQTSESTLGTSTFAWTYGHVANQVDAWLNVRFQGFAPHPLIGRDLFRRAGSGQFRDWKAVLSGVSEVRETARTYLERLDEKELDLRHTYDGSMVMLRETGITVRCALLRIVVHHYFHIGEIAAKRVHLGHDVGDYPGSMFRLI